MQNIDIKEEITPQEIEKVEEVNSDNSDTEENFPSYALNKYVQDMLLDSMDYAIKEDNAYFVIEVIKNMLEESNPAKDDSIVLELFEIIAKMANYNSDYTYVLLFKHDLLKSIFTSFGTIKREKIVLPLQDTKKIFSNKYNLKNLAVTDDSSYLQYFVDIVFKHYKQKSKYFKTQDIKYSLLSAKGVLHLCIKAIEGKYKINNEQNIKNFLFLKQKELDIQTKEFDLLYEKFIQANEKKFKSSIEGILNNFSYYFFEQKIQVIEELIEKANRETNSSTEEKDICNTETVSIIIPEEYKEDIAKIVKTARNKVLSTLKDISQEIQSSHNASLEKNLEKIKHEILSLKKALENSGNSSDKEYNSNSYEEIALIIADLTEKISLLVKSNSELSEFLYSSQENDNKKAPTMQNNNSSEDIFLVLTEEMVSIKNYLSNIDKKISSSNTNNTESSSASNSLELLENIENIKKEFQAKMNEMAIAVQDKIETFSEKLDYIYSEAKKSEEFRNSLKNQK